MKVYRTALVGVGRMGAFIDNEGHTSWPYSHSAGYEACARTELIAGADMRPEVLVKFGERYGVPASGHYTDFREMILTEQPDMLSIATQPHQRTEVALFAIEHGVRALYVEKPLCASMAEAEALLAACTKHGTMLNMGTNLRWNPGIQHVRSIVESGQYGRLVAMSCECKGGTLFNTQSHHVDLFRVLNGDAEVVWVQAHMPNGAEAMSGDSILLDPLTEGLIAFENDVIARLIERPGPQTVTRLWLEQAEIIVRGGEQFEIRTPDGAVTPIPYDPVSSTVGLIEDLVHSLDTGAEPRGGIEGAYKNTEILFALLESEKRGGARVSLPLVDSKLVFQPVNLRPRQAKFEPVVKTHQG